MRRIYNLVTLLLFVSLAFAQIPNYVPTSGLVAYYPLDGNGNDLVGTGNNLTNYGAVATTDRNGNAGAAMSFNGSSQYLLNSTPGMTFSPGNAFSVSIWYYKASALGGVAIMFGNTTGGNFIWNMQSSTSQTQFGVNKQQSAWFWAQTNFNTGVWEHYVGVYEANGAMTLYKNGQVAGTNTYTHTAAISVTQPLNVGRGISGNYFNGSLDEIAIYNRALTTAEVGLLYAGCGPLIFTQPTNQTQNILSNATFSTNATSNSTYQWQEDNGSGWANINNGGQYSGATSGLLSINNLTLANNGSQFRCLITNGACLDTSDVASLTVECINLISAQPMDVGAYVNTSTTISIGAQNATSSFQWQRFVSGFWVDVSNGGQYSGANTSTLAIADLTMNNNGNQFRCLVALAGCQDTSAVANLTVTDNSSVEEFENQFFNFYPNPANGSITLMTTIGNLNEILLIQDITGKVVMRTPIRSQEQKVDISALETGVYLLSIEGYPSKTSKLIVR